MPIRFGNRYKTGFQVIIEAEDGHFLLGGRQVDSGAVYDRFADALVCMTASLESNLKADRRVNVGKVMPFEGMVSCPVYLSRGERCSGLTP
jgi:hypothetical protein